MYFSIPFKAFKLIGKESLSVLNISAKPFVVTASELVFGFIFHVHKNN
jgi:hypothetical protein